MSDSESGSSKPSQVSKIDLEDKAVRKEMDAIPQDKRNLFLSSLEMARLGLIPALRHEKLKAAGEGVIELKINGSPAYRCMYVMQANGDVLVLHVTSKTTRGPDRQLTKTTAQRLKRLKPGR